MITLVVHQLPATVVRSSHTAEGHLGDTSFYSAELTIDGEPSGAVMGHFETVRLHESESGAEWDRVGTGVFQFTPTDTIVVIGAVTYPVGTLHSSDGVALVRAVVGGTGTHLGARGEVVSVRSPGGSFTHTFTLL